MSAELPATKSTSRVGGIVLAGGQSQRMGTDKSELIWRGHTFLEHVVTTVSQVCSPVLVVGGVNPQRHAFPDGVRIISDEYPGRGPLEGIRVGLSALPMTCQAAFVASCDTPLLEPAVIELLAQHRGHRVAAAPRDGQHVFGTTAIYDRSLADSLARFLDGGGRQVTQYLNQQEVAWVELDQLRTVDPELKCLINLNRPEDLRRLDQMG